MRELSEREVRIILEPSVSKYVLYFFVLFTIFISVIAFGFYLDHSSKSISDVILMSLIILLIMFVGIFSLRIHTILSPVQYLTINSQTISLRSRSKVLSFYEWKMVKEILLESDGTKLYMNIKLFNQKDLRFELCGWWLISELNTTKALKKNYLRLISQFGNIQEFQKRLNKKYHCALVNKYNIQPPAWLNCD